LSSNTQLTFRKEMKGKGAGYNPLALKNAPDKALAHLSLTILRGLNNSRYLN